MKGSKISFDSHAVYHFYQRAADRGIIFYSIEDRLVYYTLAAVKSKKYGVIVLAAAIMFSHIHQSLQALKEQSICLYLKTLDSSFSRLYNHHYSRSGRLFEKRSGRSRKSGLKSQKTNLIYVFNNHVEKGLVKYARESRWSFLPYAIFDNPFSKQTENPSSILRKAYALVDRRVRKNKALEYVDLDKIFPLLSQSERQLFIDYVISRYKLINFTETINRFGSFETMELAINSTTGGEYDIAEEYSRESDVAYEQMSVIFHQILKKIYNFSEDEVVGFVNDAMRLTSASPGQVLRFLHRNKSKH